MRTDLADIHRAMLSGSILFSGLVNIFGNISYAFPAALLVISLGPILDILIGRLRWDNPAVIVEILILLESDSRMRD